MDKYKEIRPVVLGLVKRDNKILVGKGFDSNKNEVFYRSLGGGIDFLEKSDEALKREYREELGIDIKVGNLLGVFENIFTLNGKNAHEINFIYEAQIEDKDYKEEYQVLDCDTHAMWVEIDKFISHELKLYPQVVLDYLK